MARTKAKSTNAKKVKPTSKQLGRNSDGTFAKGNQLSVGNKGGNTPKPWSLRQQAKTRAKKDPKMVQQAIDSMINVVSDPSHPQFASVLDKFIRVLDGYDPTESKTEHSGSIETINDNPALNQLTREDLLKALKRKR